MNEMLKKRQNKQMMNDQNHSPQRELSLECLWLQIRETEDKDETISSTSTQDFDREKVEREFINLAISLSTDQRKFQEIGRRSIPHMKK